jgi:hypothetical protein
MEAVKNAVAIAQGNLFRAITDSNRYSLALMASLNPNPAIWEIVKNLQYQTAQEYP